jgi:uncharacterized protein YerC
MAIMDRAVQAKVRKRVEDLLKQKLTTKQISERTGMGTRQILRVKKKLEATAGVQEAARV